MIGIAQRLIEQIGYSGVALLIFIENVFPPIPSEVILPFSGFVARRGDLTLWGVILAGTVGATLGAFPFYYIGMQIGRKRLFQFASKYGDYVDIQPETLRRAFDWFDTRGQFAVFTCRMIPGLRSVISIPAGMAKMDVLPFTAWTFSGSFIWTLLLSYAGWVLGANYRAIQPYINIIGWVVIISIIVYVMYKNVKT